MIDRETRQSVHYLWLKTGCDEMTYKQFRRYVSGRWLVYLNDDFEMGIYRADSAELAIADALIDYGYPKTSAAVFADLNYGSVTYGLRAVAL